MKLKNLYIQIYEKLYNHFGPQGWWPVTSPNKEIPEYRKGIYSLLSAKQKLEVIIGAILTQNTSWDNAEKAIMNLHKNNLIDVKKLLAINESELAACIRSSGYFNQKAKKLKSMALFLNSHSLKNLENLTAQELRKLLLEVKGVGKETADSIILYAFYKNAFVIDSYTKRIMSRIGLCSPEVDYDELAKSFCKNIPMKTEYYSEYHALLVALAKKHCKKAPICYTCPLLSECRYGKTTSPGLHQKIKGRLHGHSNRR